MVLEFTEIHIVTSEFRIFTHFIVLFLDGLITKLIILAGWIISLTTILLIVYANDPQATTQTKSEYLAYQTLFRTSWSIALAWIVFATAKVSSNDLFGNIVV